MTGDFFLPVTTSARKAAFTSAAGSTPGETRSRSSSRRKASWPLGGFWRSFTTSRVCSGSSWRGGNALPLPLLHVLQVSVDHGVGHASSPSERRVGPRVRRARRGARRQGVCLYPTRRTRCQPRRPRGRGTAFPRESPRSVCQRSPAGGSGLRPQVHPVVVEGAPAPSSVSRCEVSAFTVRPPWTWESQGTPSATTTPAGVRSVTRSSKVASPSPFQATTRGPASPRPPRRPDSP